MDEPTPVKACSTCREVKPLTAYAPDKRKRDGRQARCLTCHREYQKRWKADNPETYRDVRHREYQKRLGSGAVQEYRRANRTRDNARTAARRAALPEEELEQRRAAHRVVQNAYRARNVDLTNARIAAWRQANPGVVAHYNHARRGKGYGRDGFEAEVVLRHAVGDRDGWICGICHQPVDPALRFPERLSQSLDHIIPLSLGGAHTYGNSRITHYICNVRRGAAREEQPP